MPKTFLLLFSGLFLMLAGCADTGEFVSLVGEDITQAQSDDQSDDNNESTNNTNPTNPNGVNPSDEGVDPPGSTDGEEPTVICHFPPGNDSQGITLTVGSSAVPAHIQQHGDHIGECS